MGTLTEWIQVVFMGAFWGALMFWVNRPIDADERRKVRSLAIRAWILGGFLVGLVTIFGLRAFRWPLLMLLVPALAASLVSGSIYRKKIRVLEAQKSALNK